MRPRSVVVIPCPIGAENAIRISVAAAMTNQVLTSWLLATSPRSSASSSRFWVGSSERSVSSRSSAMVVRYGPDSRAGSKQQEHVLDRAEERRHHRADDEQQDEKAEQDRERDADEEYLHLRHQPRKNPEPEIEQEAEHQERRRQLDADAERGGDGARGERRDRSEERDIARP